MADILKTFLNSKNKPSSLLMFGAQVAGFAYAVHKRDRWGMALAGAGLVGTYLSMAEAKKAADAEITRSLGVAPDEGRGVTETLGGYVDQLRRAGDDVITDELAQRRRKARRARGAHPHARRAVHPSRPVAAPPPAPPAGNPFASMEAGSMPRSPADTSDEELQAALGSPDDEDLGDEGGDLESAN